MHDSLSSLEEDDVRRIGVRSLCFRELAYPCWCHHWLSVSHLESLKSS
jgi:hypothetical protein